MTIKNDKIGELRTRLNTYAAATLTDDDFSDRAAVARGATLLHRAWGNANEARTKLRYAWHEFFNRQARNPEVRTQYPEPAAHREYEFYQVIDKLEREDAAQSDAKLKALGSSLEEVTQFIAAAKPTAAILNWVMKFCSRVWVPP